LRIGCGFTARWASIETYGSWGFENGLAFDFDGFILPDDEVADLEVEGFFSPGVHSAALSQMAINFLPL